MSDSVHVDVERNSIELAPGTADTLKVTLTNTGTVVAAFALSVEGLDSTWYTPPAGTISLFPQQSSETKVTIHPPAGSGTLAGVYPFSVVATSKDQAGEQSRAEVVLRLTAVGDLKLTLEPQRVTGRKGLFRAIIHNPGNSE